MTRSDFISGIFFSIGIIIAGICFFAIPVDSVWLLGRILGILGIVAGASRILLYFSGRGLRFEGPAVTLAAGIILLSFGLVLLLWTGIIFTVVKVMLAAWFFLIGGAQLIILYTDIITRQKHWIFPLVEGAVNLFFGILVVCLPDAWAWLLTTLIATNFVLYGSAELIRLLLYRMRSQKKIQDPSLPVIVESAITGQALEAIKWILQHRDSRDFVTSDQIGHTDHPDVEILVHLSELASQAWGHVDIAVGGMVFSYGDYDREESHRHFFGLICDGVLSVCERDSYIRFSSDTVRKTIVAYKLKFNAEEMERIGENIRLLLHDCEPWEPNKKSSYAKALSRHGAKLFKVNAGLFRTYFGLNANCALLVTKLLDGTKAPKPRARGGAVTPGAVLASYENEMKRPNGCVTDRKVYLNKRVVAEEKEKAVKVRRELVDLKNYMERERNIRRLKKNR